MNNKNTEALKLIRLIDIEHQQTITKEISQHSDITPQQTVVLKIIGQNPGMIQRDLVKTISRRPATISSLLKKMEQSKLIRREIPEDNIRNKKLFITKSGEKTLQLTEKIREEHTSKFLDALSDKQQKDLIRLLTLVQNNQ
ncbi:MarR family winged helix-turn-helix transcriptional regulator [Pediococcus argentinicus]|uniref:HTH marR-type domain-containing protein n=1 Tax=Pediococcus argentinicus TaxID=480391 RepID=A0A0R2NMD4_9LACO|nr:MarR family transcriptional regulator [Pediococcus argentinicus]KRO25986.1 hypothetical protein IV88_GL001254 [Pediococcus argentinicus]NKZ21764.1 MarR family transcriptional regulator [Pediococcus argentinicus]GEP18978.1 hypothetical protein LSA03_03620 [Pediococcus argentinicus]